MALIIDDCFEYRHKKFNYGKRSRTESSSSSDSSVDYDCKQMEIEKLNERLQTPQPMETTPFDFYKEENTTSTPPPFKRMRTSSCSDSSTYASNYSPIPFANLRATSTPFAALETTIPPAAAILPKISDETLRNICKYHGNMVRNYPKKERTPKDQERRNKNTIACRLSRRVKKLEHVAIEEQYKEFSHKTYSIIEQAMRSTAYLHKLMELSTESSGVNEKEMNLKMLENVKPAAASPDKKPFTIEYLIGSNK